MCIIGITEKLDYFTDIGVDAIWISPFYKSPMRDFGYDVENYTEIDPMFGTMGDFDELMKQANKKGMTNIYRCEIRSDCSCDNHPS